MNEDTSCPECGNGEQFTPRTKENNKKAIIALLIIGGVIPFIIYIIIERDQLQCDTCEHTFRQPITRQKLIALLILGFIGLLLILWSLKAWLM